MIPFGLSMGRQALEPGALEAVAAQGFRFVEITDSLGIDLGDAQTLDILGTSLIATGVAASSVSGSIQRADQLVSAAAALASPLVILRSFPCPRVQADGSADPSALRRTVERIAPRFEKSGLALAIDYPAGRGFAPEAFRAFLDSFEDLALAAALDVGHASVQFHGQAAESAELLSGFLASVRLHDNNGRDDTHRVPGSGSIDWPAALTACWKTGFTGPWMLELTANAADSDALSRAVGARTRLQAILEDLSQPFAFTE